jgi:hypothetical protein
MKEWLSPRAAQLIVNGRGQLSSSRPGTYSNNVTCALAVRNKNELLSLKTITQIQFGKKEVSALEMAYCRQHVWKATRTLLESGVPAYTVYESSGHHRVAGMKVVTRYSAYEHNRLAQFREAALRRADTYYTTAEWIEEAMNGLKKSNGT